MRGTEQWGMLCEKVSLSNRNKEMIELIFFLANQPLWFLNRRGFKKMWIPSSLADFQLKKYILKDETCNFYKAWNSSPLSPDG